MAKKREKVVMTVHDIEDRLEEAALTMKRLPGSGGPKGYGSSWPDYVRSRFTAYSMEPSRVRVVPNPTEIQRMEDAVEWLSLLQGDGAPVDRKIVWLRAEQMPWRAVCGRVGLSRSQAARRLVAALITIQRRLENPPVAPSGPAARSKPAPVNAEGGGARNRGG
ncbi:MAG: helix-turn-helix domain-containing protein [Rhodobacteraceae bacterium]|nr:helix-turn-helix domain-containing protein [Paracoccaceae bacterium]